VIRAHVEAHILPYYLTVLGAAYLLVRSVAG
jgi:hypothetical protein